MPENFAKFGAVTCIGWLFLRAFEELSWVVIVSLAIPFVDAYSVWRGPTHTITEHHASVFTTFSIAFPVPGGNAARLGVTDVLFFAVFLGATTRFRLRTPLTWLLMVAGLGITITLTTYWAGGGLPALPGDLARLPDRERGPDLAARRPARHEPRRLTSSVELVDRERDREAERRHDSDEPAAVLVGLGHHRVGQHRWPTVEESDSGTFEMNTVTR